DAGAGAHGGGRVPALGGRVPGQGGRDARALPRLPWRGRAGGGVAWAGRTGAEGAGVRARSGGARRGAHGGRRRGHALAAAPAAAQEARPPAPDFATPFLPDDHWVLGAVRRLYDLGLAAPGFDPGRRTLTRREAGAVLRRAAELAEADSAPGARLARAYARRYAEEFPATAAALDGRPERAAWLGRAGVLAGVEVRRGSVRAGSGYDNGSGWTGPEAAADVASGVLGASGTVALYPDRAAGVAPVLRGGGLELADAHLVAVLAGVGAWVGRRPVGFGPGVGGALVLDAAVPFDGGGLFLARPLTLPGPFGSLYLETFVSRMERN